MGKTGLAIEAYHKVVEVAPGSELAVEAITALSVLEPAN